ncbi:MAG: undecaprenyl/decaprenyl-phosphate alpha-N-acetylglucosaminyl 1-phosphate transferase, partial [Actinobacteria bacterium]|nr:undecaprenyl/decaprenyl-phosphate alpha-N-acetylglucosaminyl 1-phosphate transferase [Actinomycetota bacterium]
LGFLLAIAVAWAVTPAAAELARRVGAMDQPAARKIHAVPTPRMGGIAIYFGVIIPSLVFLSGEGVVRGILVGASLITLVGVFDDVKGTTPLVKLGLQLVVAVILVLYGVRVETLSVPGIGILVLGWVGIPFSLLWVVSIMNIVNFIDGMDGLAAGVCAISSVTFAIIAMSLGQDRSWASWPRRSPEPPWGSCGTTSTRPASSWATRDRSCSAICWEPSPCRAFSRVWPRWLC